MVPKASIPRGARKPRGSKLIAELKLDKEPSTLASFVGTKEVKAWMDRGVMVATWLRDHRERPEFTLDDLFTCFMHQWDGAPADLNSFIRDLRDAKMVERGEKRGTNKLSMLGDKRAKAILEGN